MKKLLLIGSNSIHLHNFLELIQNYFSEIVIITNNNDNKFNYKTEITNFNFSILNLFKTKKKIHNIINSYKPDIIHVHQANSIAFYTIIANKSFKAPIILTAWGSDILLLPKKNIIFKYLVKFILKNSNFYSSDSKYMAYEMRMLYPDITSILIANFGINLDAENKNEIKENIIYSNRLHKKLYRIDYIIKSFSIFLKNNKDWKLVIAGIGEETESLKNLANQLNLKENIIFVGWVNKDENSMWYSKAKYWISIPESDATSISLLEAIYNTCIPILSNIPANIEWITYKENGWLVDDINSNFISEVNNYNFGDALEKNKEKIKIIASKEHNKSLFYELYDNIFKKIKICHITTVHPNTDIRIFHKECKSLAKIDQNEVFLISTNQKEEKLDNVNLISAKLKSNNRIIRMFVASRNAYKKAIKINAKIYHFHDPELLFIGLKLRKKGKIVIYDSHEDLPRQILGKHWIPTFFRSLLSKSMEIIENYVAKRLSFIVVSTPKIKDRFIKINKNCETICNYPILEENKVLPQWNERKNNICYVGGINEMRGANEMLDCLSELEDIKLNLVGAIETKELEQKLIKHKNWFKVNYYGVLNRNGVINTLNESKIGLVILHPQENIIDSLPIKLFEYMYAGIPVIASDFPIWKKIISENNCGICVNPLDINAIVESIKYLLNNDKIAEELGANGRKTVLEKYNWKNEENKLFSIYNNLINSN